MEADQLINSIMIKLFSLIFSLFFILKLSYAEEIKVFDFTKEELRELQVRKVRGADNKTEYTIGNNNNGNYIKAVADNSASGLGKEIKIDLKKLLLSI